MHYQTPFAKSADIFQASTTGYLFDTGGGSGIFRPGGQVFKFSGLFSVYGMFRHW